MNTEYIYLYIYIYIKLSYSLSLSLSLLLLFLSLSVSLCIGINGWKMRLGWETVIYLSGLHSALYYLVYIKFGLNY